MENAEALNDINMVPLEQAAVARPLILKRPHDGAFCRVYVTNRHDNSTRLWASHPGFRGRGRSGPGRMVTETSLVYDDRLVFKEHLGSERDLIASAG